MPRGWWYGWKTWVGVGIVAELIGLWRGVSLTTVARARLLAYRIGSAVFGAFWVWLGYHWGFDIEGLDHWDAVAVIAGAILGLAGFEWRSRIVLEPEDDNENEESMP